MIALNDICLHRTICSSAVRFRIWLDEELYANQIVGDGLVIASPFGSTGYYRSITNSFFQSGIGIAFNNATESVNHLVVNENRKIRVQVIRGPAILTADNDPEEVPLEAGDEITVHRHHDLTTILGLETFRCPVCYRMRHPQRPSEGELLRNLF
jgi:NAD+ kinase